MTQWAFVSDIHGNYRALMRAAVLCEARGADRFVCLGDVVGRGDPDSCVDWVSEHAEIVVVGNRDVDHLDLLTPDRREVVRAWPKEACASNFVVSHGDRSLHRELAASEEKRGFIRPIAYMARTGARLWFFGHTHRSRLWISDGPGIEGLDPTCCYLTGGAGYVVNVGTTGKPMGGRGPASVTLYDDAVGLLRAFDLGDGPLYSKYPKTTVGSASMGKTHPMMEAHQPS